MNNEDKIFELMTKMYSEFSGKFERLENDNKVRFEKLENDNKVRFERLENDNKELKETVDSIHKTVIKIENEHGEKLSALFDGWKQNTDRLDRIEKEMSSPNEVILRKIK